MYVTPQMIEAVARKCGRPDSSRFVVPVRQSEFERIKASQKNGRRHDITLYIVKDRKIVVIAKHFYPPGLYRAPSGGTQPGETIEAGAAREALEETGCDVTLERFLLEADVSFVHETAGSENTIEWKSLVFQAAWAGGDFQFTDKHEIREVRLADLDEFVDFSRIMRRSDSGGLHYRADLHDRVKGLLRF